MAFQAKLALCASIAALAAGMPGAALAQSSKADAGPQANDEGGIATIVVTATRRETNMQDTPIAITAVTSDTLETRGLADVAALGNIVPNASFRRAQGAFGKAVTTYIRGIGQHDSNLASEPAVSFYIDDVYYPLLYGSQFELVDLERIEVLRGPQGTLFGRNSLAGAVNIVSRAPQFDAADGFVNVTVGAFNRTDVRAGFNLPLAENFAVRINGLVKRREGYQDILDFRCDMIRKGTPELASELPFTDGLLVQEAVLGGSSSLSQDDCKTGTLGGEDVTAVRGSALWEPAPGLRLTVTGDYSRDNSENAADSLININDTIGTSKATINAIGDFYSVPGQPPVRYDSRFLTGDPYTTYATNSDLIPAGYELRTSAGEATFYNGSPLRGGSAYSFTGPLINWGLSGKVELEVSDAIDLLLVAGYRSVDSILSYDVDGSPFLLEQTRNNTGTESINAELRLTGSTDLFDWVLGGFYYTADGYVRTTLVSPFSGAAGLQRYQNHSYEPESKAAYANVVVRPVERFSVTLGGRYSDEKNVVHYSNLQDPVNLADPAAGAGAIVFDVTPADKRFDWKLGLDYELTDEVLVYLSASTGFRLPSFNARPFQPSQVSSIPGDETVAYEAGVKSDLFDRRLRLNLTGFFTDYKTRALAVSGQEYQLDANNQPLPGNSIAIPLPTGGADATTCRARTQAEIDSGTPGFACVSRSYYVNTPGEIWGVEVEVQAEPVDGLRLDAAGGYSKFTSPDLEVAANPRPVRVPDWTASAGIQYDFDAAALGGTISPRLDWFYQGSMVYENNNTRYNQPSFSTFNARINYYNEEYDADIALGATNLFDEFHYENLFVLEAFGYPQTAGQPNAPREWYLSVTKRF